MKWIKWKFKEYERRKISNKSIVQIFQTSKHFSSKTVVVLIWLHFTFTQCTNRNRAWSKKSIKIAPLNPCLSKYSFHFSIIDKRAWNRIVFVNFKVEKLEINIQLFMIKKSGQSWKESRSEPRDWFFNRNLEGFH